MNFERIDFISAYCDRWCARCAFTRRCSTFAIEVAQGMCGDFYDAVELAVGAPHPARNDTAPLLTVLTSEMNAPDGSDQEVEAAMRDHHARREKAKASPIARLAWAWSTLASRWLHARSEQASSTSDPLVQEALEVARWDSLFIAVKLMRALQGRLDFHAGEGFEDDPVQNDWNGSAKIALISIERSTHAWRTIAQATDEETPGLLANQLADLQQQVEADFPNARQFVRPGFDEPSR